MNGTEPKAEKIPAHNQEERLLLVDKPAGWTSFDVVNRIRHLLHVKKAGHAGTLDPLATGLLIVCTGRLTKDLARYTADEKEYLVTMLLGARTPSGDAETPVAETRSLDGVTAERVAAAVQSFIGPQQQIPPMWSAVKVRGKRLYRYAQRGETVERAPRDVVIHSIEIGSIDLPSVEMTIVCSKGTYIRTLVDDIGRMLGCGAYVTSLRRTRIGEFSVSRAQTIAELEHGVEEGMFRTV